MSKRQILEYLLESNTSVSPIRVCLSLAMAVVLGMLLYFVYRKTYRGTVYSKDFNLTLLLVTIITTLVMQAIGSNLALSLGMVGSLSIIRFRTAVKEPRDIAFIFWAICIGIGCGSEFYLVVAVASVILTALLLLGNLDLYDSVSYLLVVRGDCRRMDAKAVQGAVQANTRRCKLRMQSATDDLLETTYEVRLRGQQIDALTAAVRGLDGVTAVNLVSYSGELLG